MTWYVVTLRNAHDRTERKVLANSEDGARQAALTLVHGQRRWCEEVRVA